jgi:pyruvate dehydrogenase E1 component
MFGWQRTGDQMWAMGDQLARGFLIGATAGRTTLTGEGLQHNDGHSPLLASVSEACISYDPAWAYEIAVITKDALRRMYDASPEHPDGENIFYYLTVYNEPYPQPPAPDTEGLDEGILRGMYRYSALTPPNESSPRAQVLASGVAMPWALNAQRLLAEDWGVAADVWSVTSWTELRRDALACESHNLLKPGDGTRVPYVTSALDGAQGPVVAVSDWIRAVPDQIARWVPTPAYTSLGTDGFGFSDTRPAARRFFHVDAESIVLAVLAQLAKTGKVDPALPAQAIAKYKLDLPVSEVFGS